MINFEFQLRSMLRWATYAFQQREGCIMLHFLVTDVLLLKFARAVAKLLQKRWANNFGDSVYWLVGKKRSAFVFHLSSAQYEL